MSAQQPDSDIGTLRQADVVDNTMEAASASSGRIAPGMDLVEGTRWADSVRSLEYFGVVTASWLQELQAQQNTGNLQGDLEYFNIKVALEYFNIKVAQALSTATGENPDPGSMAGIDDMGGEVERILEQWNVFKKVVTPFLNDQPTEQLPKFFKTPTKRPRWNRKL